MIINPYQFGVADEFTNGAGQQGVAIWGDSTGGFATDSLPGPTPSAGTVYEWNGSAIVQVGSTDLLTATGGSMWPKYGIDTYNATGKKTVFSDCHIFDSSILLATNSASAWLYDSTNFFKGTCYTNAKTKSDGCLAALGLTKFKAIYILLTTNDIGDALFTATQINTAYTTFLTYLQADYPGSPIYLIAPGPVSTTTTQTALQADVKFHIINTVPAAFTGVECAYYAQYSVALNLQTGAHWNSVMNNYIGASLALYRADTETNLFVKRITNHFAVPLTAAHRAAWKTAIVDLQTEGFMQVCNYLKMDVCTNAENERFNITGITQPIFVEGNTYVFTANDCIQTGSAGAQSFQSIMFVPSLHTKYGDVNDQICMNYLQINNNAAAVACSMFASGISGWRLSGISVSDNYQYNASDVSTQFGVVPRFPANFWYGVRSNGVKEHLQNTTIRHTAAYNGSPVLNAGRMTRGGGQGGSLFNGKHEAIFIAKASGYTLANVLTILNTLRTALKTP